MQHHERFRKLAGRVSHVIGSPWAFVVAALAVIIWGASGPMFGFSDTWQLVINTSTTIITFLVVFLIQNTQNHDAKAIHLKLDELIRAVKDARTGMVDLEDLPEDELNRLEGEFRRMREHENGADPDAGPVSASGANAASDARPKRSEAGASHPGNGRTAAAGSGRTRPVKSGIQRRRTTH